MEHNHNNKVPQCGKSDNRNLEYSKNYSPYKFFRKFIDSDNPLIIDVGAHHGESILYFKSIFPFSKIISFEPQKDNFEKLKKIAEKNNSVCFNFGVGNKNEKKFFYHQSLSHLGSFLKINTRSKDSLGYAKDAQNQGEQVDLISLNSFCLNQKIKNIDLIKIDVQGFEAEVLLGSSKILKNVKSVMIEISLYDFYNGNSRDNFYSVHKLLNKYNFQLWDISKISKNPKNLRTDWLEAVFINSQL